MKRLHIEKDTNWGLCKHLGEYEIVIHDTARSVVEASCPEPLDGVMFGSVDENGDAVQEVSADEYIEIIENMGLWGFNKTLGEIKEIHVWIGDNVTNEELLGFFAHEYGHAISPNHRDIVKEEAKAERYAEVAGYAFVATMQTGKNFERYCKIKDAKIAGYKRRIKLFGREINKLQALVRYYKKRGGNR